MAQIINNHKSQPSLQETPCISTNQKQPITGQESQKAILPCKCKTRHAIPACQVHTSYPSMNSKRHCIKGAARVQNSGIAETAEKGVGVRRAQY